jgi:hypothetical protein
VPPTDPLWDDRESEACGPRLSETIALVLADCAASGLPPAPQAEAADVADLVTDRVLDAFQVRLRPATAPRGNYGRPLRREREP